MIKKVVVFWLWRQWKQFLRFFKNNNYDVIWVCKSIKTKNEIEKQYWIVVYTDYKKCLNNNIDLLVLCAFPILIYEEIFDYSSMYNYKILCDLPMSFNFKKLSGYLENEKLFLFLLETKTEFFKNFFLKNKDNISSINCLILQNKDNLKQQVYTKESVIVDSHYLLNNLLWINYNKLNLKFKFIEREIKDVEYIIELFMHNSWKIIYKYEDGKGIIIFINNDWEIIYKKDDRIVFDMILKDILNDIWLDKNCYKKEYFNSFNYLLTTFNYENKNN